MNQTENINLEQVIKSMTQFNETTTSLFTKYNTLEKTLQEKIKQSEEILETIKPSLELISTLVKKVVTLEEEIEKLKNK